MLSTSGSQKVSAKVTDSRGISKSSDPIAIEVLEYKNPSITLTVFRVDENGDKKANGAYLQCNYSLDYSPFNGKNKVTVTVYGVPVPGNSDELAKDSTATSGSKNFEANPDMAYKVYAIVTDSLGGQGSSATTSLLGAERIINIYPDGTGVAFGKKATQGNLVESKYPIKAPGLLSETELFTNVSGTAGTITLNESAANFTYLELFYHDNNNVGHKSIRVHSPNGKAVSLMSAEPTIGDSIKMYIRSSAWHIYGNKLIPGNNNPGGSSVGNNICVTAALTHPDKVTVTDYSDMSENNTTNANGGPKIQITRIVGYK